jgi:ribosomal protein S18 acetylase RimI-like enzyme
MTSVRPAVAGDLQRLRTLFLQSRRETFAWRNPEAFQLTDLDAQTHGELILVAEDEGGRVSGFLSVWQPDNFIHHLYVDRQCFRRGVGRALLRMLPGWSNTCYRLKCLRMNEAALAFYRACGFVEIGSGAEEDGEYLLLQSGGADSR